MELDDLKSAWRMLDRRLEQQSALTQHIFRQDRLARAQSKLRPLYWGQILQILFGMAMIACGAAFWTQHRDALHLMVAGLTLHVYGAATIILAGITLGKISRIDYSAAVVDIQKQLGRLGRFYVFNGLTVGLPWWLLWIACLMILATAAGVDLYAVAPAFVWINVAVGIAGLLATRWFLRWSRGPRRPRLTKAVDDALVGMSLRRAQRVLDEIAAFEHS